MTRYFRPQYRYHSARYLKPAYVLVSREMLRLAVLLAFVVGLFLIYGHMLHVAVDNPAPASIQTFEAR